MQIHELPTFTGSPGASDYMPIDDGSITYKVAAQGLGITDEMTQAEAETGTSTSPRVITPAVFNASAASIAQTAVDAGITQTTKDAYTAIGWVEP